MANSTTSARETAGLRGQVKTCIEQTVWPAFLESPERRFSSTTEYDPSGRELSIRHVAAESPGNSSESVTIHEYDDDGRLVKFKWSNADSSNTQAYAYDQTGRMTTESFTSQSGTSTNEKAYAYSYDATGRLLSVVNVLLQSDRTDYRYDQQGRKTTVQTFDPELLRKNRQTASGGSAISAAQSGHGVPDGGNVLTLYNDTDQPTEARVRDAGGTIVTRAVRTYDEQGRVEEERTIFERADLLFPPELLAPQLIDKGVSIAEIKEKLQESFRELLQREGGEQGFSTTRYTYDAQGRVTETHRQLASAHAHVETVPYNEHGDKAEEYTTRSMSRSVDEQYEARHTYQYDERDNWTEQIVTSRSSPSAEFAVIATYRRRLVYF
jgi:YD repeat-containing protein